jgi:hypothetical protein
MWSSLVDVVALSVWLDDTDKTLGGSASWGDFDKRWRDALAA